jgi:hypothetical protein
MEERRNQQRGHQAQQSQSDQRQPQQNMGGQSRQGGTGGLDDRSQNRGMDQPGRQQGGPSGAGQQRQFDTQGSGQQSGGSGATSRFADQIREHMEVIDDRGRHCGTVDHVEGDRIKLARSDSKDGQHHYVAMSQIAGIEGNKVRLRERGDDNFGMEAGR